MEFDGIILGFKIDIFLYIRIFIVFVYYVWFVLFDIEVDLRLLNVFCVI